MFSKAFSTLLVTALAVSASPAAPLEARQGCAQMYTVQSGDICSAIETTNGVSDAQLRTLNPLINSGCTNLQIGQVLCLSSGDGCGQTYTVVSGDTCAAIESGHGVSDAQLHALNPSIDRGCTNLQIGQVLCLGSGSGGGGGSSFTGSATYYDPEGNFGACGWRINNGDMAVALKTGDYASGAHCGQSITVTYNGHSITVVVADLCPGCQGTHGIDLTEGAMATLDANYVAHGVDSVTWHF